MARVFFFATPILADHFCQTRIRSNPLCFHCNCPNVRRKKTTFTSCVSLSPAKLCKIATILVSDLEASLIRDALVLPSLIIRPFHQPDTRAHPRTHSYDRGIQKQRDTRDGTGPSDGRSGRASRAPNDAAACGLSCRFLMSTTRDIVRRFKVSISDPSRPRGLSWPSWPLARGAEPGSDCSPWM